MHCGSHANIWFNCIHNMHTCVNNKLTNSYINIVEIGSKNQNNCQLFKQKRGNLIYYHLTNVFSVFIYYCFFFHNENLKDNENSLNKYDKEPSQSSNNSSLM